LLASGNERSLRAATRDYPYCHRDLLSPAWWNTDAYKRFGRAWTCSGGHSSAVASWDARRQPYVSTPLAIGVNPSLSLLFSVRNSQTTLHSQLQRLLDVLPELTGKFEVFVIDDGSTDATCEIAYDFSRHYPQLKVFRHTKPIGWAASIAKQAAGASGEYLMIHCGGSIEPEEIAGLWRLRQGIGATTLAKAKAAQSGKTVRIDPQSNQSHGGVEVGQETTILGSLGIHSKAPRSNLLLVHRGQLASLEKSLKAATSIEPSMAPGDITPKSTGRVKGPSFLGRVKSFARGE
jgi:hypothetical protein